MLEFFDSARVDLDAGSATTPTNLPRHRRMFLTDQNGPNEGAPSWCGGRSIARPAD